MDHLITNNILSSCQFGFRNIYIYISTISATYKLTNDILMALNNKWKSGSKLFDLDKAFSCVKHNILLAKMKYYGITGVMYSLIESYLRNRHQRVRFKNRLSNWGKINRNSTRINFGANTFFYLCKWHTILYTACWSIQYFCSAVCWWYKCHNKLIKFCTSGEETYHGV
jgi:hypothetical protein